jgi:hypothetical protein
VSGNKTFSTPCSADRITSARQSCFQPTPSVGEGAPDKVLAFTNLITPLCISSHMGDPLVVA